MDVNIYFIFLGFRKKISKYDNDVQAEVKIIFERDIKLRAPNNWYPKSWLAFLLCGRHAPRDRCFLTVTKAISITDVDAIVELAESSTKTVRRTGRELLIPRKDGEHSSQSTPDVDTSDTSSDNRKRHIDIFINKRIVEPTVEERVTPKDLLRNIQDTLDVLYKISIRNPDEVDIQVEIEELEREKVSILRKINKELRGKLGYENGK